MLIAAIGESNVCESEGRQQRDGRRRRQNKVWHGGEAARWITLTNSVTPRYKQGAKLCEDMCMNLHKTVGSINAQVQATERVQVHVTAVRQVHGTDLLSLTC